MINQIKKIIDTTQIFVNHLSNTYTDQSKPVAQVDLQQPIHIRTFQQILIHLTLSGYWVYIPIRFTRNMLRFIRTLRWFPKTSLGISDHKQTSLLIKDHHSLLKNNQIDKIIQVVYNYPLDDRTRENHIYLPYIMHPQIYTQYQDHENLTAYQKNVRKVRILFSGNWNESYNRSIQKDEINLLPRLAILDFIKEQKLGNYITSPSELNNCLAVSYLEKFVILEHGARVDQSQWLSLLSKADFFLSPPGLVIPFAHNVIEAMAVGTIPLLNYVNWFNPELIDGHNCIAFRDTEGLKCKIDAIMNLDASQISMMRENVIDYYNNNLDPRYFINKKLFSSKQSTIVHVLDESEKSLIESINYLR